MVTVFFCHSSQDAPAARALAGFLERGAGVMLFLREGEISAGQDLLEKTREGLMAEVILVLLSPHSAPVRWSRDEWIPVFREEPEAAGVKLATALVGDCHVPDLLRRKNFFDLRAGAPDGFRAVKRWVLGLRPPADRPVFESAGAGDVADREGELETLRRALADAPGRALIRGAAGTGKTALALEFARRAAEEFEGVCWLSCCGRSPAALAGDLAAQLGLRLKGAAERNAGDLRRFCSARRVLLVLDDAGADDAARFPAGGASSVLATARRADVLGGGCMIDLGSRTAEPAALAGLAEAEQRLLAAACACAPCGFEVSLAAEIAGLPADEARRILPALESRSLVRRLNRNGPTYYVPSCVRGRSAPPWLEHARAVRQRFGRYSTQPADRGPSLAALQHAFGCALSAGGEAWTLACDLARSGFALAAWQDRLAEAFEFMEMLSPAAERQEDRTMLDVCLRERIWILREWGRLEEAAVLEERRRKQCSDQMWLF